MSFGNKNMRSHLVILVGLVAGLQPFCGNLALGGDQLRALSHELETAPSSHKRESTARALGELGDPDAVPILSQALGDKEERVKWAAAEALGKLGTAGVERLIKAMEEDDQRRFAGIGLRVAGSGAVDALVNTLAHSNSEIRVEAARSLGVIGDARAITPLTTMLGDPRADVRDAASYALRDIGEPAVVPLVAMLNTTEESVRYHAMRTLGDIGSPSSVDPLSAVLAHGDSDAKKAAAWVLGATKGNRAVSYLIDALSDSGVEVQLAALNALQVSGHNGAANAVFKKYVEDQSQPKLRRYAIAYLATVKDTRILEPLIKDLEHRELTTRRGAAEALGALGDPRAVAPLIRAMESDTRPGRTDLRDAVSSALRAITGKKFQTTIEWQRWWETSRDSGTAEPIAGTLR
jgi:HEAT repeat protein